MKFLKHGMDEKGDFQERVLLHIPVGFINALLLLVHWALVLAFAYIFWHYERNEDAHSQDQAWKDLYGWMVGFIIGGFALLAIKIIGGW